jgi:26S proteasome regulatory subunit N12
MSSLQELSIGFIKAFEAGDYATTAQILPKIKVELAKAGLMVPSTEARKDDLLAARHVLEMGVLAAIHTRDEQEINRLVAQIRPFYAKQLGLPHSSNENKLMALYLLLLVSKGEIAEFHTELETLDNAETDQFLAYPVRLERWLMEGSYDKVWKAITEVSEFPSPEFAILAESLVYTVRSEIAACAERAYESLPLSNARHLFFFKSDQEALMDFINDQPGWEVVSGRISFENVPKLNDTDDSTQVTTIHEDWAASEKLIANTLGYAQQIETII